jgi:YnbE-like lipoprotein
LPGRERWTRGKQPDTLPASPKETWRMLRTLRFGKRVLCGVAAPLALALLAGCTPKVQVEAPKEPITINMNIKIEHEIRIKVDKDLDQLLEKNDDIF